MLKKILTLLVVYICSLTSTSFADWYWRDYGDNYHYVRVNDAGDLEPNPWLYKRVYYCGAWKYVYDVKLPQDQLTGNFTGNLDSKVTINYSNTWKEQGLKQLGDVAKLQTEYQGKLADGQQFLQFVEASGLKVNLGSLPGYQSYQQMGGGPYGPQMGMAYNGIQVLTQGTFGQGGTVYGQTDYAANRTPVDWNLAQHNQMEYEKLAFGNAQVAHAGMQSALQSADHEDTDLQKFELGVQGILAVQQGSTTPRRQENSWSAVPSYPQQPQAPQGPQQSQQFNQYQNNPPPPPGPELNQSSNPVLGIRGQVAMGNHCAQCHSGDKGHDKKFNFESLAGLTQQARSDVACDAVSRVLSHDPDKMMPPPDYRQAHNWSPTEQDAIGVYQTILSGSGLASN